MTQVYLASQSPRRKDILTTLGLDFKVVDNPVIELRQADESPSEYVTRLAIEKSRQSPDRSIACIGADTIGVIDGDVLEKPKDKEDAFAMWSRMSGRSHTIHSAIAISKADITHYRLVSTEVFFRVIQPVEMEYYWASGEPQDKAGGYAIQGLGGAFVERINGSYHSVVGLPMVEAVELLRLFNITTLGTQ